MGKEALIRKKFLCPVIILLVFFTGNAFGIEILGIHFAPDKQAHKPIITLYDGAEKYIYLAICSLTKDEFSEALVRAHKRGIEVKVLIAGYKQLVSMLMTRCWLMPAFL